MLKSEKIKKEIIEKVTEFYKESQKEKKILKKINYAQKIYNEKELINLVTSSLDFNLTYGNFTKEFEKKLCEFLNVKYSIFVNSGSSANLLAFKALTSPLLKDRRLNKNDEVITTACCFPTTIAPIIQFGAIPVFVDINLYDLNINVSMLERALTEKTKAVLISHTLGIPADIKNIKDFCNRNNLWLIEDNCDSLGSKVKNKYTGTFGDIGTSSFYPAHHITTGEGGAVYTNNDILYKIIISLRDWGRDCICEGGQDNKCKNRFSRKYKNLPEGYDHKYVYTHLGFNLKATDLQASIGCAQIDKLPLFISLRQVKYDFLLEGLKSLYRYIDFIERKNDYSISWFGFPIILKDDIKYKRNKLMQYLESKGIQSRVLFAGNIINQPCFESLEEDKDYRIINNLNNSTKIMNDALWIGVHPGLSCQDLNYMINTIKGFFS